MAGVEGAYHVILKLAPGLPRIELIALAPILLLTNLNCRAQEPPDPTFAIESITYTEALEYANQGGFDYERIRRALDMPIRIHEDSHTPAQPENIDLAKAYWIDAYNRNVISTVLDAEIATSVMDAHFPFFDRKQYPHFGQQLSLNDIEKRMLFLQYPDARLHFALVCGAQSCPPLYNKPFSEAEDLDRLLDSLTVRSVNDTLFVLFNALTGDVLLSKLFDWYEKDYELESGSVMEFIARYHKEGEKLLGRTWKKKFRDYDWSLNQRPKRSE
jgi:hypothetical protein